VMDMQTVRYLAGTTSPGETVRFAKMFHVFCGVSRDRRNPYPRNRRGDPDEPAYAKWSGK
jgi:hypothetical protein